MPLETGTYISDFVLTNPDGDTDTVASLDDQDRLIKTFVQNTFPNANGAITASVADLNSTLNFEETVSATTQVVTIATGKNLALDAGKLVVGGTTVTPTAAELNILSGVTATAAEINTLDVTAATTYSGVGVLDYFHDDIASAFLGVSSLIGASWESIGPTGVTADNTWTVLDVMPSGVKAVRLGVNTTLSGSTSAISYAVTSYARKTGSALSNNDSTQVAILAFTNSTGSAETVYNTTEATVPVDASGRFDMYINTAAGTSTVRITLKEFIV